MIKNKEYLVTNTKTPRIRTINEEYEELVSYDCNTAITKNFLRSLVVSGKLPSVKAGRKYLINMDTLRSYLYQGETKTETVKIGTVRPINENLSFTHNR